MLKYGDVFNFLCVAKKILRIACFISPLLLLAIYSWMKWNEKRVYPQQIDQKEAQYPHELPLLSLDTIPFSLQTDPVSAFTPKLEKELQILSKCTRPDKKEVSEIYLIEVLKTNELISVKDGQVFYLDCNDEGEFFLTDSAKGYLSAKIIDGVIHYQLLSNQLFKASSKLFVKQNGYPLNKERLKETIDALKRLQFIDKDQLIELYGKERFADFKGKLRLFDPAEDKMIFVKANDFLIYEEGRFRPLAKGESSRPFILSQVKLSQNGRLELTLWDETGFSFEVFKFEKESFGLLSALADEFSNMARKSGHKAVFCKIGGEPLMLKEGDWVIKKGSSWDIVDSKNDLIEILTYKKKYPLFVFDSIEKNGTKFSMKGHFFDERRIGAYEARIPLQERKPSTSPLSGLHNGRLTPQQNFNGPNQGQMIPPGTQEPGGRIMDEEPTFSK